MDIKRDKYLNDLINRMHNGMIKVVTGIQEKASLVNVNDSFKKIIVVKDVVNVTRDEDGITTMSIYDFLLKENSLEL